jgi:hypothetical protein
MAPDRTPTLLAVLANPPLRGGVRTLRRVELAARLLDYASVDVANLFALPTHTTSAIALSGTTEEGWLSARPAISNALLVADGVLLAYGKEAPSGPARARYLAQVDWLHECLRHAKLPVWQVGDSARHPSRWQRWTCRAFPGVPFEEALRRCFVPVHADAVGPSH